MFVAGLAMSRLHLLEGISGTGKTSLPLAFAEAVGAGVEVIPVQADWRDRQQLLGSYNAFEGRFHESLFLQALYRARTPRWKDHPLFIVLDELNLSRPEQYFADFISALEQPMKEPLIELVSHAVQPAPKQFREGRFLPLPRNVWFVGTANHDETTLEIADKTYDRAHVLELPRRREPFDVEESECEKYPLGFGQLQHAFGWARKRNAKAAEQALSWLDEHLKDPLYALFRLGWGNRLDRQMRVFVPVVVAGGGTKGEAVDHIVATRLLRRIRDRHDVRQEAYRQLREAIETHWADLDEGSGPTRSLAVIESEIKRLSFDRAEEEDGEDV